MIAAKMMPIVLFVFVFSLLLERLLKFYGPQSPIMLAVTSFAILSVALYIILSPTYSSHDKNWAYVSVGIVLGLWLKNSRQQPTT
jgi:predicted membrane chloride channel (bestrophin family)